MADLTFDAAAFRVAFPAFCSEIAYPTATLQAYWDAATCYISDNNYGKLADGCRVRAINLMLAHLATISGMIAEGNNPSQINSATIDKISVSMTPPKTRDAFEFWLSTTPYGMQLWAMLLAKSTGGFYVGGLPERSGFRRAFGGFNG